MFVVYVRLRRLDVEVDLSASFVVRFVTVTAVSCVAVSTGVGNGNQTFNGANVRR